MADDTLVAENGQYGLELALTTHSRLIKTKEDLVIVWLHWCFLKNGMKSHGGEFTHRDYTSENLPYNLGWNGDKGAYILKYRRETMPYAVGVFQTGTKASSQLEISLVSLHRCYRIVIKPGDIVDEYFQLKPKAVTDLTTVIDNEFIQPILPPKPQPPAQAQPTDDGIAPDQMASIDTQQPVRKGEMLVTNASQNYFTGPQQQEEINSIKVIQLVKQDDQLDTDNETDDPPPPKTKVLNKSSCCM